VPEAVVDDLEVVDVGEEHRDGSVGAAGARQRELEPVEEDHAVRQPGEGVVRRLVLEALLERLALADVARDGRDELDVSVGVVMREEQPDTGTSNPSWRYANSPLQMPSVFSAGRVSAR